MRELRVKGLRGTSKIVVGESLDRLETYIDRQRTIILTDTTVDALYGQRFPDCPVIKIGLGERIKSLETAASVFDRLIALEADRSSFLLGIGGGIVCDMAGFVASTYMRGTRFGFVATTLLAQVDASVGGKNGVNIGGYKNMVGVFNQPEVVICDLSLLKTLPTRELLCGFAEIIKHGAIADAKLLDFLQDNRRTALQLVETVLEQLVQRSVEIKAGVVSRDEHEHGERRVLNFGHTFGHAIEKLTGVPHGEAVGMGMVLAARLSVAKGLLSRSEAERLVGIIEAYGLPVTAPAEAGAMLAALRKDKKRVGDRLHFVFLEGLGRPHVAEIAFDELAQLATIR